MLSNSRSCNFLLLLFQHMVARISSGFRSNSTGKMEGSCVAYSVERTRLSPTLQFRWLNWPTDLCWQFRYVEMILASVETIKAPVLTIQLSVDLRHNLHSWLLKECNFYFLVYFSFGISWILALLYHFSGFSIFLVGNLSVACNIIYWPLFASSWELLRRFWFYAWVFLSMVWLLVNLY